ncbi:MAG: hypothetical protein J2P21_27160 [Chloracidobacterium sp.]|nr:hypothetical protein [Chloracidobacterium sp.]
MRLKRFYYFWSLVVPGFGVLTFTMLSVHSAPFARHFPAQPQTVSVVNRSRPAEVALEIIQDRHGVVITYEDAPYSYEADVDDDTSPEWRRSHPNGFRALVPKRGSLEVTYYTSRPIISDEIRSAIQKVLDANAEKNYPGRFRLRQEGEMFHVEPTQVRDRVGRLVNVRSILDASISFPQQELTGLKALEVITTAVSRARGINFVGGTVPQNRLYRTSLSRGANHETARDILIDVIKATNSRLSWWILYGPDLKEYVLNLREVR